MPNGTSGSPCHWRVAVWEGELVREPPTRFRRVIRAGTKPARMKSALGSVFETIRHDFGDVDENVVALRFRARGLEHREAVRTG